MQTTDVLARWRQPADWRRPGRVALANASWVDPEEAIGAALLAEGVELCSPKLDREGALEADLVSSDVVVSGGIALGDAFFAGLETTRLLLRPYVGYDDIDVPAATAHGVLVANVPDAIAEDVANHALALILAANREILRLDSFVRTGGWARTRRRPEEIVLHRPSAQTLGLVGFGMIARATAWRAGAFGYRMVAHDPYVDDSVLEQSGVHPVSLDELLAQADVVSVHVLLNDKTRHLIDGDRLAQMKPTAWLVNTARGAVVDLEALTAALREERIGGAALDVVEGEPLSHDSRLVELDNVILSPHIAGYSVEGIQELRARAAEIAVHVASGGLPPRHVVVNRGLYDEIAAMPELVDVPRH